MLISLFGKFTDATTSNTQPLPRRYAVDPCRDRGFIYTKDGDVDIFLQAKCLQTPQTWREMLENGTHPSEAWTAEVYTDTVTVCS